MNQEEQGKKISQLIAKCWADEGFKQKILTNPVATLRAEGLELPADLSFVAHENTDKVFHLVIPAKPTELSDEDLAHVAGGTCQAQISGDMQGPRSPSVWYCNSGPANTCCGW
jgi:Nitrile hydratase, alpha chain